MTSDSRIPNYIKFLFASISGVGAAVICYPLELVKTRMQVSGEGARKKEYANSLELAKDILRKQGPKGLYSGLSASILRQATYTGIRLGAFQTFVDYFSKDGKPPPIFVKMGCGVVSGAMGALAGLPADVALTRMAADARLPPEKRRNYKNVFNALQRIVTEEGAATLSRGISPTVIRAVIVNVTQVVTYMQAKEAILEADLMGDNTALHITCSVIAAIISTLCSLPPDVAKVRMQNMKIIDGKPQYSGLLDVWTKIVTKEGPLALWKGLTPVFIRNGPMGICLFLINENLMYFYKKNVLKDDI